MILIKDVKYLVYDSNLFFIFFICARARRSLFYQKTRSNKMIIKYSVVMDPKILGHKHYKLFSLQRRAAEV